MPRMTRFLASKMCKTVRKSMKSHSLVHKRSYKKKKEKQRKRHLFFECIFFQDKIYIFNNAFA